MNELDYEMPFDYQLLVGDLPPRIPDAASAEIPANAQVRIRIRMPDDRNKAPPSKRMRDDANRFDLVGLPSIAHDNDGDDDTTDAAAAAAAAAALAAARVLTGLKSRQVKCETSKAVSVVDVSQKYSRQIIHAFRIDAVTVSS
jgi:hypothetical protein